MFGNSRSGGAGYADHQHLQSQQSSFGSQYPDSNRNDSRRPQPPQDGRPWWPSYCEPQCGPSTSMASLSFGGGSVASHYDNHSAHTQQSAATSAQHQQQSRGTVRSFMDGILSPFVNCVQPQLSACITGPSSSGVNRPRNDTGSDFAQQPTHYQNHFRTTPSQSHYPPVLSQNSSRHGPMVPHSSQYNQQHHDRYHRQSGSASTSRILASSNGVTYNAVPPTPVSRNAADNIITESIVATISQPNDNDVLCGRGNNSNWHPGNVHFRELIAANKVFYSTLTKKEKMLVARQIVDIIHHGTDPPGRFISRDTMSNDGLWYDIGLPRSLEKTSQALREKSTSEKQQLLQRLQAESDKGYTISPGSSLISVDDRSTKEIEGFEMTLTTVPLSPPSSTASGTTMADDTTTEEVRSTFSSSSITHPVASKSKSRVIVEPPPIKIPDHLKSIYHKTTDNQPKPSSSTIAAISPPRISATTSKSSKSVEHGPNSVPPCLQTPPLGDHYLHPLPPYLHQTPKYHQHVNYRPAGNFHHYSAPPSSGYHQPQSYPLPPTGVNVGSHAYQHHPHQYLRPRVSSSRAGNEHHGSHVPPPHYMMPSSTPPVPIHAPSAPYNHYHPSQYEQYPPPHRHPSYNPNGMTHQHPNPSYSSSGPNIVTPNATHDYTSGDSTPTTTNRKVFGMEEYSRTSKLKGPLLVAIDDDPIKQQNHPAFDPPVTPLTGKEAAGSGKNCRKDQENGSFSVSPERTAFRSVAASNNTRDISPTLHQDFKRQKVNQLSITESKIETNQKEKEAKVVEVSSSLQAIVTQLSLEDKVVGNQRKNANERVTPIVESGSKLLTVTDKVNMLTSPSALTQGRLRPRSNGSLFTKMDEDITKPFKSNNNHLNTDTSMEDQPSIDHDMDGLAALSAAAFLRLDESG